MGNENIFFSKMKFSLALLAAVSAESSAVKRLAKIEEAAADFKNLADNHQPLTESRRARINKQAARLMDDVRAIDTSACPDEAADEAADLEVNMNFVELCEDSGSFPSMVRSYARKFGCVEGFPKRNFLKRLTNRSHKLKRVTQKYAKCDKLETTETAQYRCDFVPGAIPVEGSIYMEERKNGRRSSWSSFLRNNSIRRRRIYGWKTRISCSFFWRSFKQMRWTWWTLRVRF